MKISISASAAPNTAALDKKIWATVKAAMARSRKSANRVEDRETAQSYEKFLSTSVLNALAKLFGEKPVFECGSALATGLRAEPSSFGFEGTVHFVFNKLGFRLGLFTDIDGREGSCDLVFKFLDLTKGERAPKLLPRNEVFMGDVAKEQAPLFTQAFVRLSAVMPKLQKVLAANAKSSSTQTPAKAPVVNPTAPNIPAVDQSVKQALIDCMPKGVEFKRSAGSHTGRDYIFTAPETFTLAKCRKVFDAVRAALGKRVSAGAGVDGKTTVLTFTVSTDPESVK